MSEFSAAGLSDWSPPCKSCLDCGNRSRTAELLGVSLRTVRNKVRSYGLPSWSSYVHH